MHNLVLTSPSINLSVLTVEFLLQIAKVTWIMPLMNPFTACFQPGGRGQLRLLQEKFDHFVVLRGVLEISAWVHLGML